MIAKRVKYELNGFWVFEDRNCYTVFRNSGSYTHSVSDSSYEKTEVGLSFAIARVDYLNSKKNEDPENKI